VSIDTDTKRAHDLLSMQLAEENEKLKKEVRCWKQKYEEVQDEFKEWKKMAKKDGGYYEEEKSEGNDQENSDLYELQAIPASEDTSSEEPNE